MVLRCLTWLKRLKCLRCGGRLERWRVGLLELITVVRAVVVTGFRCLLPVRLLWATAQRRPALLLRAALLAKPTSLTRPTCLTRSTATSATTAALTPRRAVALSLLALSLALALPLALRRLARGHEAFAELAALRHRRRLVIVLIGAVVPAHGLGPVLDHAFERADAALAEIQPARERLDAHPQVLRLDAHAGGFDHQVVEHLVIERVPLGPRSIELDSCGATRA